MTNILQGNEVDGVEGPPSSLTASRVRARARVAANFGNFRRGRPAG